MKKLRFFDCNTSFGSTTSIIHGSFSSVNDLIDNLQKFSVEKALVYNSLSKGYHPIVGNKTLIDEISDYPTLMPVWAVIPNHTGEFYSLTQLEESMIENKVKAVRIFPNIHKFSIAKWCCGELLSWLEIAKIPIIIEYNSITVNELYQLCKDFSNLRIILIDIGYGADRNLYPLLKLFPNLYIQSAGYRTCNGIENICAHFGAERIIFGSGIPSFSIGSAIATITYANISQQDKEKIACGNLEAMLNEVCL